MQSNNYLTNPESLNNIDDGRLPLPPVAFTIPIPPLFLKLEYRALSRVARLEEPDPAAIAVVALLFALLECEGLFEAWLPSTTIPRADAGITSW